MPFDHRRELLVRLESLPLERLAPALEERPRPAFALIVPELAELLLEHVRGVQPSVRREKLLQTVAAVAGEVLPAGEQRISLALDERAVLASEASVLAAPDLVERVDQVAQHVEPVEDDARVWRVSLERIAERPPHIHHRELETGGLLGAQRGKELVEVLFATPLPAEPDRPCPLQV